MVEQPSTPDYLPFDQERHLGDPPWFGPTLKAWEEGHGHDARVKCYPEFGCQAIQNQADRYYGALTVIAGFRSDSRDASDHWGRGYVAGRKYAAGVARKALTDPE